jgi:hypothetical protein
MSDETSPKIPIGRCPICGKRAVEQHRPFCSRRCAVIDLGRWIGGNYRVPTAESDDEEEGLPKEEEPE